MHRTVAACIFALAVTFGDATEPFQRIAITPQNENTLNFVVNRKNRTNERILEVLAPASLKGRCTPNASGMELHTKDGQLVFEQKSILGASKGGPELRGTIYRSTDYLLIWLTYECLGDQYPSGYWITVDSRSWEASQRMR
jgi:hypothetical protein